MSTTFPYHVMSFDGDQVPYPMIPIPMETTMGIQNYNFIFDTGADITTMPHYMMSLLGVKKKDLEKTHVSGVGTTDLVAYQSEVDIIIGDYKLQVPCLYMNNNNSPLLLGKKGIFDQFNVYLDNDRSQLILTDREHPIQPHTPTISLWDRIVGWLDF